MKNRGLPVVHCDYLGLGETGPRRRFGGIEWARLSAPSRKANVSNVQQMEKIQNKGTSDSLHISVISTNVALSLILQLTA